MKRLACLLACLALLTSVSPVLGESSSSNYTLQQYSFGAGGSTPDQSNGTEKLFGNTSEPESDPQSPNYTLNGGLSGELSTDTPQTPTLTNDYSNYDRLHFTLDPGSDPSDTKYAIAISPDGFTTTYYISASLTLITSLSDSDWQTYSTWGGSSGAVVTGLSSATTYTIKVKALQGDFTESDYSPTASAATVSPTLTFSVSSTADMGNWSASNSYSSTTTGALTTSTNAFNGYNIYAYITGPLTQQGGSSTIANYSGTYASPKSWTSGTGFGYTTDDTSIAGSPKWNATPCPGDGASPLCYAAFSMTGPGDVVADHETAITGSPIVNETFNLTYKVTTTDTQPAGTYSTTAVYTVAPIY